MRGIFADGVVLRSIRIERGLTQEELARLAGLDVKTIRKAESGGRLALGTLERLGQALDALAGRLTRGELPEAAIEARNLAVVQRGLRAWDARDLESLIAGYHEEATLHLPGGPPIPLHGTFHGKDEIRRVCETAWSAFPTAPTTPAGILIHAAGDALILEGWREVQPSDGEAARLWWAQIVHFVEGRVIDHRVVYDTLEFIRVMELPTLGDDRATSR